MENADVHGQKALCLWASRASTDNRDYMIMTTDQKVGNSSPSGRAKSLGLWPGSGLALCHAFFCLGGWVAEISGGHSAVAAR